jgi:hypothetical protein
LRLSVAAIAFIGLAVGLSAIARGLPVDVALPAVLLAPILAEHLPDRLDARAREHVRSVEGNDAVRYLQRLAALHTYLVQADASEDRYELHRSAEIGQNLLWDAADLLQARGTHSASAGLIDRERLMHQLADQVAQLLKRSATEHGTADAGQRREALRPLGPHPPCVRPPTPQHKSSTGPLKGTLLMPQTEPTPAVRTTKVYLLFAHEPYYPGPGTRESTPPSSPPTRCSTRRCSSPTASGSATCSPKDARPGEIVPLSTLTHELNGGADWPAVGDWERVTTDLVRLVRSGKCDALSLGLPDIARALVCTGPHSHVRAFDAAANEFIVYGPAERAAVLTEVDVFLASLVTEHDLWPGDGLLHPQFPPA